MQPMILVAAGPEQAGRAALALAVELARPLGGRLVLARVVPGHGRRPTHATQLRTARRDLERLPGSGFSGATLEIDVISSPSLLRGLHDAAVIHEADLLVLEVAIATAVQWRCATCWGCRLPAAASWLIATGNGRSMLAEAHRGARNATARVHQAFSGRCRPAPTGCGAQIVGVFEVAHRAAGGCPAGRRRRTDPPQPELRVGPDEVPGPGRSCAARQATRAYGSPRAR